MIQDRHFALLKQLSTDESPHSGRTLLDHLVGTHDLLSAWGNDDDVCLGGLFHSIYGTAYYRVESASLDRRPDVAAVIGDRAEELAFLFCVTDRSEFLSQAGQPSPVLGNRTDGSTVSVAPATINALLEIEFANVVEQIPPERVDDRTRPRLAELASAGEGRVSEGAAAALSALLAG